MFPVLLDAKPVPLLLPAPSVLIHLFFKAVFAKLNAIMDLLLLDQYAEDALMDVFNAPKTSCATTVLTVSTCTMELAIRSALLEQSEIAPQPTGSAHLAIPHARPASITLHTAQAAKTERDTFKLQLSCNLVFKPAMMEPMPIMEFARSAISSALPALEAQATVSPALKDSFSIREDVGPLAPVFFSPILELRPPVLTHALMDSTSIPPLPVLPAQSNAQPVMEDPATVPHASKDQFPPMEPAQLDVVRMSSASLEFALLAMNLAMDAQ